MIWYNRIRDWYVNCIWDEAAVQLAADRGRITQAQADEIIALPRVCD